ncbi:hypothetical protein I6I68_06175 [Corynebacterium glucuronolyticum]|uniref:hypothetical protein n=1 Tax=Corynebacterium glucuronolyticum TaxID=39791 RepID=UPI00191D460F|nr:hypothetical protein [Corynebacterium glucuronolyticum]QQU89501.1 hypothetical protein I6I68_06175 [Corynebacterium glucuronolyticum]
MKERIGMQPPDSQTNSSAQYQTLVEKAEALLSRRFGGQQKLTVVDDMSNSPGTTVVRVRVAPNPFVEQRTLVVKQTEVRDHPYHRYTFECQLVAYQFLTALPEDVRPGPILLGSDVDSRILIISDTGDADTYADLLVSDDEDLRLSVIRRLGATLGRMHAGTAGHEKHFNTLVQRMAHLDHSIEQYKTLHTDSLRAAVEEGTRLLGETGLDVPSQATELAKDAVRRLNQSNFKAFTPFNLAPDNIIHGDRTSFLDYEWCAYRDVAFDIACVATGFPQYVSTNPLTAEEVDAFISSWTAEITDVWPSLADPERLQSRIVTAMVGWAFGSLAYIHHGSLSKIIEISGTEVPPVPDSGFAVLRADDAEIQRLVELGRQDLTETFAALATYAGKSDRFTDVSRFANDFVSWLQER